MPKTTIKETTIQRAILDNLLWRGILAWRNQAIPIPIRRGRQIVGLRRADPHTVGIPDILAVSNGRLIGIEVKSVRGVQSPEQKHWEERLKKAGAVYILARSWEEVALVLDIKN